MKQCEWILGNRNGFLILSRKNRILTLDNKKSEELMVDY